jgi:hypothetical protein
MISALGALLAAFGVIAGILGKVMVNSINSKIDTCNRNLTSNISRIWDSTNHSHDRITQHIEDHHSK